MNRVIGNFFSNPTLLPVLAVLVSGMGAVAQEITLSEFKPLRVLPGGYQMTITGDIETGLLEAIRAKMEDKSSELGMTDFRGTIAAHLDSEGGSFPEALEVAEYFAEQGITTVVDRNAKCLSACAIIFMAGRMPPYEGPGWTSRFLHIDGELGFHAPYIPYFESPVLDKEFEGTQRDLLKRARQEYDRALRQIGLMLSAPATSGLRWPPSLVGEMLLTSGADNEFRYIETIDDAIRWHIPLLGVPDPDPDLSEDATKFIACMNWYRMTDEERVFEYDLEMISDPEYIQGWSRNIEELNPTEEFSEVVYVSIDEMNAEGCTFKRTRDKVPEWMLNEDYGVPARLKYPPNTRLDSLD